MENTQDKTTVSCRKCKHITDSDHQIGTVSDLLVDVFVHHLTELSNAGFNFDRSRRISILRRSYFDCQRQILATWSMIRYPAPFTFLYLFQGQISYKISPLLPEHHRLTRLITLLYIL